MDKDKWLKGIIDGKEGVSTYTESFKEQNTRIVYLDGKFRYKRNNSIVASSNVNLDKHISGFKFATKNISIYKFAIHSHENSWYETDNFYKNIEDAMKSTKVTDKSKIRLLEYSRLTVPYFTKEDSKDEQER